MKLMGLMLCFVTFLNSETEVVHVVSRTLDISYNNGVGNGSRSRVESIYVPYNYGSETFLNNIAVWEVSFFILINTINLFT